MRDSAVEGMMPRELSRDGYWAFDWKGIEGAFDLNVFLRRYPSVIEGRFAVNASFDSGLFKPSREDYSQGWIQRDGFAVSPRIPRGWQLPEHDCAPYDEWYVFEEVPNLGSLEAYCNYMGFSPIDYGWDEKLEAFWEQLRSLHPVHCIGDGTFPFFVTRCKSAASLARGTEQNDAD